MVLALAMGLAVQGWRKGALAWLAVVFATFALLLALKVVFLSCTPVFAPWDIRSPSGHVAAATVMASGVAGLFVRSRRAVLLVALGTAVLIGVSRVTLGAHSVFETFIGAAVGLAGATVLAGSFESPPPLRTGRLALLLAALALLFHGFHLPAEAAIRHTALRAGALIPACAEHHLRP